MAIGSRVKSLFGRGSRALTPQAKRRWDVLVCEYAELEGDSKPAGTPIGSQRLKTGVSDNVGGVKPFSATLPRALEQERHFAVAEEVPFQPRLAS